MFEYAADIHVLHSTLLLQLNGVVPHDNLVLIKMRPDEHGRFGFNVKVSTEFAVYLDPPSWVPTHGANVQLVFLC